LTSKLGNCRTSCHESLQEEGEVASKVELSILPSLEEVGAPVVVSDWIAFDVDEAIGIA
jgi:hypothetical protein